MIISWIVNNLEGTDNPRKFGKALKDNLSEYYKFRIGSYRLIANIYDEKIIIEIVDVGHRKDNYK